MFVRIEENLKGVSDTPAGQDFKYVSDPSFQDRVGTLAKTTVQTMIREFEHSKAGQRRAPKQYCNNA